MKSEKFEVFGDEALGRIFAPYSIPYDNIKAVTISPIHGRSVSVELEKYKWLSIKGGGWNYRGPQIYISAKDAELVFGLYSLASAERELAVSRKLEKISERFPKVLYYRKITDEKLPDKYDFLKTVKFSNNSLVNPCIIYTQLHCPYRVSDLIYLNEEERESVIKYCCEYWGISTYDYIDVFTKELAKNIAILHKGGFINDTLDYGNVTMLSEVVDYEWVTAPGILLFDGTYGLDITDERKEKEILYGAEIVLQLTAMLHKEYNLFDIYRKFVDEYSKINLKFINENQHIHEMLERKTFIL